MVEIASDEEVREVEGVSRDAFLIGQDVEGVLFDNTTPFIEFYNRVFGTGFALSDVDDYELGEVGRDFEERRPGYRTEHLFNGVPEELPEPEPGFEPFHPAVNRFWREDAERVKEGKKPEHLDPMEKGLPGSLKELKTAAEDCFGEAHLYILTGRSGTEEEMKTLLEDTGIIEGEHYDGFHVVPDVGPEDKLDKDYNLYVDDAPHRPVQAEGEDIVFAYNTNSNDAHRGYERAGSVGIPDMESASHTLRWLESEVL
ncbi:MAG: hypothetical protein MUP63_03090 [Candidatus Nanohaloarchaeota archaeon QJJ-7]|nr:hypothetical protein [Candidatus Nanohaloarchaeota archaeon QJJ-7]